MKQKRFPGPDIGGLGRTRGSQWRLQSVADENWRLAGCVCMVEDGMEGVTLEAEEPVRRLQRSSGHDEANLDGDGGRGGEE